MSNDKHEWTILRMCNRPVHASWIQSFVLFDLILYVLQQSFC